MDIPSMITGGTIVAMLWICWSPARKKIQAGDDR
jgi:hypothetical protein